MVELGFGHIFEDDHILVVNKPAGIATQAPQPWDSLESRIRDYQRRYAEPDGIPYLGIPHRLDRCVSGVIVFAKRKKSAQRLSKQFEQRRVEKTYHALVAGSVTPRQGTWSDYVRKVPNRPLAEIVGADDPAARRAVLHYTVEFQSADYACLRVQLETGRMHQIRVQCAAHGFPVLGDQSYGSCLSFGPRVVNDRDRGIALHASRIRFDHPRTRTPVTFEAPHPGYWPHLHGGLL